MAESVFLAALHDNLRSLRNSTTRSQRPFAIGYWLSAIGYRGPDILDRMPSSALTALCSLPITGQVMSISCHVAEMISRAWRLVAGECRTQRAFSPTLSLHEPCRRGKCRNRNGRLGPIDLSLCQ
jgi:hypothetical protein